MVIGNGADDGIQDIVFVRPEQFSALRTPVVAQQLESINRELQQQHRPFLLIGFGRWGSSHPSLGIPVEWAQISGARAIVEATLPEMNVELSQGSHFFHNLSSFGKLLYGAERATVWNQLGLAEPAARLVRDRFGPSCAAERQALAACRRPNPTEVSSCRQPKPRVQCKTVKPDEPQFGIMLHALQERAKELNCLYQVGELVGRSDRPIDEIFRDIIEVLPSGWQYPHECQARILFENLIVQTPDFKSTPWVQKANIIVQSEKVGTVEVSYRRELPKSDEGPFLEEERRLIETIAERIGSAVTQRRLKAAFGAWSAADGGATAQGEWRVVLGFCLRDTDPALLKRISRKLINHLSWSGVPRAKELLQRGAELSPEEHRLAWDDNRPLPPDAHGIAIDLTNEAFQMAGEHMSENEILNCVTRWIKEDKSSFLVRALENQDTSLGEIMDCVERYRHIGVQESELSLTLRKGSRVSLKYVRFFSENLEFINVAKNFIEVNDFYDLLGKVIFPPGCHGKLGGESAGLFLAKKIIDKAPEASPVLHEVKVPKTWYLTSDWIQNFVHHNDLEDVLNRKYMEIDQVRQEYPHLVALFKSSSFPSEFSKGLALALEDLGDVPADRPQLEFAGRPSWFGFLGQV